MVGVKMVYIKTITLVVTLVLLLFTSCSSSKNITETGFSKTTAKLIMSADHLKPMRVLKITQKKDSLVLRQKSSTVIPDKNNIVLRNFIKRLYATVTDSASMGVGIAAPQVGVLKQIIWVQRFDKPDFPFEVYLNPKIENYSKSKQTVKEGCLSIPNRSETLNTRAENILLTYHTLENKQLTESVSGFTAVIFQHEIDHLNGILYLDHLQRDIANTLQQ
jgi:peptide deformylase